jgi:hypothetical protein
VTMRPKTPGRKSAIKATIGFSPDYSRQNGTKDANLKMWPKS